MWTTAVLFVLVLLVSSLSAGDNVQQRKTRPTPTYPPGTKYTAQGIPVVEKTYPLGQHRTKMPSHRNRGLNLYREYQFDPWVNVEKIGDTTTTSSSPTQLRQRERPELKNLAESRPSDRIPSIRSWGGIPETEILFHNEDLAPKSAESGPSLREMGNRQRMVSAQVYEERTKTRVAIGQAPKVDDPISEPIKLLRSPPNANVTVIVHSARNGNWIRTSPNDRHATWTRNRNLVLKSS